MSRIILDAKFWIRTSVGKRRQILRAYAPVQDSEGVWECTFKTSGARRRTTTICGETEAQARRLAAQVARAYFYGQQLMGDDGKRFSLPKRFPARPK